VPVRVYGLEIDYIDARWFSELELRSGDFDACDFFAKNSVNSPACSTSGSYYSSSVISLILTIGNFFTFLLTFGLDYSMSLIISWRIMSRW